MNCPDHDNEAMHHCPSCLAEYWRMTSDRKDAEIAEKVKEIRQLKKQLRKITVELAKVRKP